MRLSDDLYVLPLTMVRDGQLHGPNPGATSDVPVAMESVRRLAQEDVQLIVCYHGGVVQDDTNGQLRRVAADE
jgi:hypothetical protein